jgi:hypothetical protein
MQMAFELIVPEASAPAFGIREATCATTCRTINPFRCIAMMAVVQRFNQDPRGWLRKFSSSATAAGRNAIARLLSALPAAIVVSKKDDASLPDGGPSYLCQAIEAHQIRLKLAANLVQIRDFCTELDGNALHIRSTPTTNCRPPRCLAIGFDLAESRALPADLEP